ncbi:lipopolysaccharide assembly protein LapB [Pleionea sp. CnH1-48]|uniref:tetratricopeptide repeat protein n=1 Tax=Pleionea sp. CnH1-48 TaxID=2954494 RepID=UPI002096E4F3|nr:CDC27 family protein [Pleionea sp. CnH1-48]MCO7223726.1 hypothetical protein [Pleionea sp. CnH1-48]
MFESERLNKLFSFWSSDKDNEVLVGDILEGCIQSGELNAALSFISGLPNNIRQQPLVAYKVGVLYLSTAQYEDAEATFQSMHEQMPEQLTIVYNWAYSIYSQSHFSRAYEVALKIQEQWQECPEVMILLARCEHALGDLESAQKHLEMFLSFKGEHIEAQGLLSLIYTDLASYENGYKVSKSVLVAEPLQLEACIAFVTCALAIQKVDEVINVLEPALNAYSEVGRLWMLKGELCMLESRFDDALSSLNKAVSLMPAHIGSWHLMAWSQILIGEIESARESFISALNIDRNFSESHGGLAVTQIMLNDTESAKESTRRALGLDAKGMAGRYAQSLLLEREGEAEKAKALIEQVLAEQTGRSALAYLPVLEKHLANNG